MRERTTIGIVGGGPSGLMLSHLLHREGIEHIVVEARSRAEIENTHRAGILEQGSADMLVDGVSDRVLHDGARHDGIDIRINGDSHHVDFQGLVGASTYLYPQTDVFIDLADEAGEDGRDVRFGLGPVEVDDLTGTPVISYVDPHSGERIEIKCELLVSGGRRIVRLTQHVPPVDTRRGAARVLPRVPLRVVRHHGRDAAEPRRTHLRP